MTRRRAARRSGKRPPIARTRCNIGWKRRPAAVKPQMQDVVRRQKDDAEFAYLLETASARLGRAITNGDMETLLYLYETAGLPAEVILMVIVYTVSMGKGHMRYIEKTALSWADNGIDTIDKAEQYLCRLDRRDQAWACSKRWGLPIRLQPASWMRWSTGCTIGT